MRTAISLVIATLVAAPLSILLVVLMQPFWSWFEANTGVESVGHSGPAPWCYLLVFASTASLAAAISLRSTRGK